MKTSLMDEVRSVDIIFLDFSKAFDTVTCKIPIVKLLKYGLGEQTGLKTGRMAGPRGQ